MTWSAWSARRSRFVPNLVLWPRFAKASAAEDAQVLLRIRKLAYRGVIGRCSMFEGMIEKAFGALVAHCIIGLTRYDFE